MFKAWGDCVQTKDAAGNIIDNVATLSCLPTIFLNLLSALLAFVGLFALIMFIIGGFKFMDSEGDAKKLASAENNFKYGIIGGLIVLFSFVIIYVIATVTNVQ